MRFTSCTRLHQPVEIGRARRLTIKAEKPAGVEIPRSLDASVSQACQAIRQSLYGNKRKARRSKSLKRVSVEIPTLDTSVENALYLISQLIEALESDGRRGASVICFREDVASALKDALPHNTVRHIDALFNGPLTSRLLVFNPTPERESELLALVEDSWRGEIIVLFNPEFSEAFKMDNAPFLQAVDAVYCFMPLAVKFFIRSRDGVLFRWQKQKGVEAMWQIFIEDNEAFKQIGQQSSRPTQTELETAMYNATAAESPISKGIKFIRPESRRNLLFFEENERERETLGAPSPITVPT